MTTKFKYEPVEVLYTVRVVEKGASRDHKELTKRQALDMISGKKNIGKDGHLYIVSR